MPCGVRERERCCCCPCLRESASNSSFIAIFFPSRVFVSIFSLFLRPLSFSEAFDLSPSLSPSRKRAFLPLRPPLKDTKWKKSPSWCLPREDNLQKRETREERTRGARAIPRAPTVCSSLRRRRPGPNNNQLYLLLLFLRLLPPPSPRARGCSGSTRTGPAS